MTAHLPRPPRSHSRECCIHEAIHSRKMEGIHRDRMPSTAHGDQDGVHTRATDRTRDR